MDIKTTMLEKFEIWGRFKEKAALHGYSTNDALVRVIRRCLAKGFDDGEPKQQDVGPEFENSGPSKG